MPKTQKNAQKDTSKMTYSKDTLGKEILYKDSDLPVMMEWEKPYVEACIDALHPHGDVLEIGFGLGYSAQKIQHFHPKSHTIIESNPDVIKKAKAWAKEFNNVKIIEGQWQEIVPTLDKFDAIFFDDYIPHSQAEINDALQNNSHLQDATGGAEAVRDELAEALDSFKGLKFSDDQLEQFKEYLLSRPGISKKQITNFLQILTTQGNITAKQSETFLHKIKNEHLIADDHGDNSTFNQINIKHLSSSFIEFAEQVLEGHMKTGATLSGYVGVPSLTPNHEFQQKILSRKDVGYIEKAIKVEAPKNCSYFKGNIALVIVLKKK